MQMEETLCRERNANAVPNLDEGCGAGMGRGETEAGGAAAGHKALRLSSQLLEQGLAASGLLRAEGQLVHRAGDARECGN